MTSEVVNTHGFKSWFIGPMDQWLKQSVHTFRLNSSEISASPMSMIPFLQVVFFRGKGEIDYEPTLYFLSLFHNWNDPG